MTWGIYVKHPLLSAVGLLLRASERAAPRNARPVLRRAVDELVAAMRHSEGVTRVRTELGCLSGLRLNIGCGKNPRPGWVNIDMDPAADVSLDIRQALPFPDSSCTAIYSEHTLEHLQYPGEVEPVLRDWFRMLAPGGTVTVGVPDTEWFLVRYGSGDRQYFEWCRAQSWCPAWARTPLDVINNHFRQTSPHFGSAHLYAYDFETVAARLEEAGFGAILRRDFDPSIDSEARRDGTLYVVARKPERQPIA